MSVLDKSVTIICPDRNKQEVGELRNKITDAYHQSKTRDHIRLLQRHKIIEERKEMLEQKNNANKRKRMSRREEKGRSRRRRKISAFKEKGMKERNRERRMSSVRSSSATEWTRSTLLLKPRLVHRSLKG